MLRALWPRLVRSRSLSPRPRRVSRQPRRRDSRLSLEILEDRLALSTFLVTNSADNLMPGSLRYAITQANLPGNDGSIVRITNQVTAPIVLTAGELPINASMTIRNDSGAPVEIRQTTANARVLHIGSDAATVTITGVSSASPITIDGGSVIGANGGGILEDGPTDLTLTSVEVTSNRVLVGANAAVGSGGGGIYAAGGTLTLDGGSSVSDNQAPDGFGGGINVQGIKMQGGSVIVQGGSHVDGNSAFNEGGIRVFGSGLPGTYVVQVLDGSTVNGNSSTAMVDPQDGDFGGGGIAVEALGSVLISASQVSNNHTVGMYSGGIVVSVGSVTVTDGSQITGNTNQGPGGGIAANFGGTVTVTGHSQVSGNTGAAIGGGIVNFSGPRDSVTISEGSEVSGNTLTNAESLGQAIAVFLQFIRSQESLANFASAVGELGGVAVLAALEQEQQVALPLAQTLAQAAADLPEPPGLIVTGGGIGTLVAPISVTRGSQVNGNRSGVRVSGGNDKSVGFGGGVFSILGSIAIDHSTVSANTAPYLDGGGIFDFRGAVTLDHATVSDNRAFGDGGGIWSGGEFFCDSSTIADNTAGATGGALFTGFAGRAWILDSVVQGNHATYGGGMSNLGRLTVVGSQVIDNDATKNGGGIWNGGRLRADSTTIANNTAAGDGGGLFNAARGWARIVDSAFIGNSAGGVGGGIANAGYVCLIDTLFADNTPNDISQL